MWQLSHPRALWPRYLYHIAPTETPTPTPTRKLMAPAPISILSTSSFQPSDSCMWYNNDSSLLTFLDMLADHIDWLNPAKTPSWFLSTFSSGHHARNWANCLGKMDVTVYKIDTTKLPARTRLFSMETLDGLFNLKHEHARDEMLVSGRIPEEAIVDVYNFMDVDTTPGMYCLLLVAGDWYVTDGSHRIQGVKMGTFLYLINVRTKTRMRTWTTVRSASGPRCFASLNTLPRVGSTSRTNLENQNKSFGLQWWWHGILGARKQLGLHLSKSFGLARKTRQRTLKRLGMIERRRRWR